MGGKAGAHRRAQECCSRSEAESESKSKRESGHGDGPFGAADEQAACSATGEATQVPVEKGQHKASFFPRGGRRTLQLQPSASHSSWPASSKHTSHTLGTGEFYLRTPDGICVRTRIRVKRPARLLRCFHDPLGDGDVGRPDVGPREGPLFPGGLRAGLPRVGRLGPLVRAVGTLPPDHAVRRLPLGRRVPPPILLAGAVPVVREGRAPPVVAGMLARFAGGLLPPRGLPTSPVLPTALPAWPQLALGPVAAPLLVLPAAPAVLGRGVARPARGLAQAVLLVQVVMPGREGGAVPAQGVRARHRHVLKLIQQPGQGAVLGDFVAPHDALYARGTENGGGGE